MKLKVIVAVVLLVNVCAGAAVDTKREKRTIGKVLGFFGFKIVPINEERNRPTEVLQFDAIRQPQFKIPRPQSQSQNFIRDEPFRINLPNFDVVSPSAIPINQRIEVVTNPSPVDVSSGATDDLIASVFNTENFPPEIAPTMRPMSSEIPLPSSTQSTPTAMTLKPQSLEPVLTFPASTDPFSTRSTIIENMPSFPESTDPFSTRSTNLDPIIPYPSSTDPFSTRSTLDVRSETMAIAQVQTMNLQMQTIGLSPLREEAFKKFQTLALEYKNSQEQAAQAGNSQDQSMTSGNSQQQSVQSQNFQDQSMQSGNFQDQNMQSGNFQGQNMQSQNFQGQNMQLQNFQGQNMQSGSIQELIQSGNFQTQSTNLPQEQPLDSRINQEQSVQSGNTQTFNSRDFASSSGQSSNFASSSGQSGNFVSSSGFQSFPSNDVTSQFFSQPSYYINQGTPQNYQRTPQNYQYVQQTDYQPNYLQQNHPQQASSRASINMDGQQLHEGYTYHNPQFY